MKLFLHKIIAIIIILPSNEITIISEVTTKPAISGSVLDPLANVTDGFEVVPCVVTVEVQFVLFANVFDVPNVAIR